MEVIVFSENEQLSVLEQYNQAQKKHEQIPCVPRNAQTGWPLLQVSLYAAKENTDGLRYDYVLAGGKCHFFHIGAFNLAGLLAKIYGKVVVTGNQESPQNLAQFRADNVGKFLDQFSMSHKELGIEIRSESGAYGKTLKIRCSVTNPVDLANALENPFAFAVNKGAYLKDIGGNSQAHFPGYSPIQIDKGINKKVAVFFNGQIFVDLGAFLMSTANAELRDYFKAIFRVDEFRKLQEINPDFKPGETQNDEVALELTRLLQNAKIQYPRLNNVYLKIKVIKDYGIFLATTDKGKSNIVIRLAHKLETKVDDFYKKMVQDIPSAAEVKKFKQEFKELLHSQDKIMKEQQKLWKPILGNTLLSLTGVGFLALAVKMGVSAYECHKNQDKYTLNKAVFFATNGVSKIEKAINLAPDTINFAL